MESKTWKVLSEDKSHISAQIKIRYQGDDLPKKKAVAIARVLW